MRIKIEVNCYDTSNVEEWALSLDIYAKNDSEAKVLAHRLIDVLPEEKRP